MRLITEKQIQTARMWKRTRARKTRAKLRQTAKVVCNLDNFHTCPCSECRRLDAMYDDYVQRRFVGAI